jgi:hypothetical protein
MFDNLDGAIQFIDQNLEAGQKVVNPHMLYADHNQ